MRCKIKWLLAIVTIFWLISFASTPIMAFSSDSFSQQVGEEYVWEIKTITPGITFLWPDAAVGDQLKVQVTTTNTSLYDSKLCDIVWGIAYNYSASNRTWNLVTESEVALGAYNKSYGIVGATEFLFFIPHNESAIEDVIANINAHYQWTSGPNGYDGIGESWENDVSVPGSIKVRYQFNSGGVLQDLKAYNATGSTWDLTFHMELQLPAQVPGFSLGITIFMISLVIALISVIQYRRGNFRRTVNLHLI